MQVAPPQLHNCLHQKPLAPQHLSRAVGLSISGFDQACLTSVSQDTMYSRCQASCCTPELDSRRGQSMALPAKKRRAEWYPDHMASAQSDPLSGYTSAQECKRQHLSSAASPHSTPCSPSPPFSPPASPPYVFPYPTGSLSDRFVLSNTVLGSGQFGKVRHSADSQSGEPLACKSIRKVTTDAENMDTQQREIRNEVGLLTRLQGHENVVQLRGVFEEQSEVHLVMDLCKGGELFDEVIKRQRFQERDAAILFFQAVKGVAFCHSRGVMHRDLKPENLLLTRKLPHGIPLSQLTSQGPLVKLADFGLASSIEPGQMLKGVAGSPFYMAPEVLTGEYNTKADVWSLGVILYILLSGSPPFWGENDEDVFKATLKGKLDLTTTPWDLVSEEAKGLIRCMLVRDPAKRPAAQKVLSHPWTRKYCSTRRDVRTVSAVPRSIAAHTLQAHSVRVV